jgi:hypothetical protein
MPDNTGAYDWRQALLENPSLVKAEEASKKGDIIDAVRAATAALTKVTDDAGGDLDRIANALECIADHLATQPKVCPSDWRADPGSNLYICHDCGKTIDVGMWDASVAANILPVIAITQHYRFL